MCLIRCCAWRDSGLAAEGGRLLIAGCSQEECDRAVGGPLAGVRGLGYLPDLIGFVLGLGVAWVSGWTTTDLVWSLWLSSLVVGYAMILWSIGVSVCGNAVTPTTGAITAS